MYFNNSLADGITWLYFVGLTFKHMHYAGLL